MLDDVVGVGRLELLSAVSHSVREAVLPVPFAVGDKVACKVCCRPVEPRQPIHHDRLLCSVTTVLDARSLDERKHLPDEGSVQLENIASRKLTVVRQPVIVDDVEVEVLDEQRRRRGDVVDDRDHLTDLRQ